MERKFSRLEINTICRIATTIAPYLTRKNELCDKLDKLNQSKQETIEKELEEYKAKIIARVEAKVASKAEKLEHEIGVLEAMINSCQTPIKAMTGGYTTEDLVMKEEIKTGKINTATGKEIIKSHYVLRYPETVIPVTEEPRSIEEMEDEVSPENVASEEPVDYYPEEYLEESAVEDPHPEEFFQEEESHASIWD